MISLARFSIRRPWLALAGWLVIAAVLALIGLGVSSTISPTVTVVPGTQSARAEHLAKTTFGPSQLVPILLQGPAAQLNRQGPALVRDLLKRPHTRVLSAWDKGTASAGLRPSPRAAMIIVAVDRSEKDVVKTDQGQIERLVAHDVTRPARAYVSGQPSLDRALKNDVVSVLRNAAFIAFAVVFGLLLIGLRSPLSAALVTVVTGATTLAAFGVMALLGKFLDVDALALTAAAIAGLARGASFSVVMLDRFHHDDLADPGRKPESIVSEAIGSTGRALLFAGTAMVAAMLLADLFGTTTVLATLGIGAVICTLLATGAAVVVVPAALVLFGPALEWRLPAPAFLSRAWDRMVGFSGALTRHPLAVGALATAAMLALAVPALGAKTGPQDIKLLPPDNQARVAFERISHVMGPGYLAQFAVVVVNPKGPITSNSSLTALRRYENKVARNPAVYSVTGPGGSFSPSAADLKKFGPSLVKSAKISDKSKKDLLKLIDGLGQAGAGSAKLQSGLAQAASGAGQANSGSGQLQAGAGLLHKMLGKARAGSAQISAGLAQALSGATALRNGAGIALSGASKLAAGLGQGAPQVTSKLPALSTLAAAAAAANNQVISAKGSTQATESSLNSAVAALGAMTTGKSDPKYGELANALHAASASAAAAGQAISGAASNAAISALYAAGTKQEVSKLAPELTAAATGAALLRNGILQLRNGNAQLAGGLNQLSGGGSQLTSGLGQLTTGAGQLEAGLAQLTSGTGQLAAGLSGGVGPAGQLISGLGLMQASVIKARGQIPSTADLKKLQRQSPGIFNSGYFVLSAIAGAPASDRNAASYMINLNQGGNAAQILIVPRYGPSDPRTEQLGRQLRTLSGSLARTSHLDVAVGGPAGSLFDVAGNASDKLVDVMIGTAVGVALLLTLMLRSVLIPWIAVLCAALVTATGFGVMELLFGGSNPPLGGPGRWYPILMTEIVAAIFGATLLYLVVLVTRARDNFILSGDARGSIVRALGQTLAATSGIALITIGVVVPFMFTELQPVRMVAVAAALAVALVAFVVIPVILPAAMAIVGRLGWWPTKPAGPAEPAGPAKAAAGRGLTRRLPRPAALRRKPGPAH